MPAWFKPVTYVYVDGRPITASVAEPLGTEFYNNLMPPDLCQFAIVELSPSLSTINLNGVGTFVSSDLATLALSENSHGTTTNKIQQVTWRT